MDGGGCYGLLLGLLAISSNPVVVAAQDVMQVSGVTTTAAKASMMSAGTCCDGLSFFLEAKVSSPGSTPYNASLASYWSDQEAELEPTCIVSPTSSHDVALSVFLLSIGNKLFPGKCNFSVRSGGHTPQTGAANIDSGITIDLKGLNQVTVSSDQTTVTIGPGNRWGDVYSQIEPFGLTVPGGRVATVGVGGLLTGGGLTHFTPRFGFACDSIENFEVVLATGATVNANAETKADLWRALRGGSNNFGIVTAFTIRAIEQAEYLCGHVISEESHLPQQFAAFEEFLGNPNYDPYAQLQFNVAWEANTDTWLTIVGPSYTKAGESDPAVLRNFTSVPSLVNTMRLSNASDFARELASPGGMRDLFVTNTYKNSAVLMQAIHDIAKDVVKQLKADSSIQIFVVSFQPLPSIMFSHAAASGGNSLGLDDSDGNLFNVLLTAVWTDKSDDELITSEAKLMFDQFAAKAEKMSLLHPFIYLNYAAPWQDVISGYGADNVDFLRQVSKKYDEHGLFQKNVPGGFKLLN